LRLRPILTLFPYTTLFRSGKGGYNIKLAGKLTGYEIDVYREADGSEEDVDLDEFTDEIEDWIIDELKAIGCDTAKSVLNLSVERSEEHTSELQSRENLVCR